MYLHILKIGQPFPAALFPFLCSCHSVYTEHNARDIGCFVRCQEYKGIGNILRLTQAAQRDLLNQRIDYFLGNSLHHIGQGNTGSDCIHSNTLRTQFPGKGNRQAMDAAAENICEVQALQ